jgi:acetyltransferase-like isoleucine patch superfamily enzyme
VISHNCHQQEKVVHGILMTVCRWIGDRLPFVADVLRTAETAAPITLRNFFMQKIMGFNRNAYWPAHFTSIVCNASKVRLGVGTAPGIERGCYIQASNGIEIGDYTIIGPNVGLITANHDPCQLTHHNPSRPLKIGSYCLIGMNAVILPGVEIGDHTIVCPRAVVNRSFPDGYCVLAGVPAKLVKRFAPDEVCRYRCEYEYIGYHSLGGRKIEELYERLGVRSVD